MIIVRPIEKDDIYELASIHEMIGQSAEAKIYGPTRYNSHPQNIQAQIDFASDYSLWLVATENDNIAGFGKVSEDGGLFREHLGTLSDFYILPEYRKRGIGEKLLAELLAYAKRSQKIEILLLYVNGSNLPAINLYQKKGFFECGRICNGWKTDEGHSDLITMFKNVK